MPSPFPGMDPYLEAPEVFPDLHDRRINGLSDAINQQMRPPYFSTIASRVMVTSSIEIQPVVIHGPRDEFHELSLEIRTIDDERLMTLIEILCLSNKLEIAGPFVMPNG